MSQVDLCEGVYPVEQEASSQPFTEFVQRHARFAYQVAYAAYQVAYARLRNPSDAEDAVQEALLKLYRGGRWRSAESERAFPLARTVWRVASTLRRRAPQNESVCEGQDTWPGRDPNPEQLAMQASAEAEIHRMIDSLPEKLRQPLVLCSLEEMSSADVGLVLGLPGGTVRRRVMEARALLRSKLKETEKERHHER